MGSLVLPALVVPSPLAGGFLANAIRVELVVGGLGEVHAALEAVLQALFDARGNRVGFVPDKLIDVAKLPRKQKRGFKDV